MIHHFQTNMRIPCYRCFSSKYNAGRCKVVPAHLEQARQFLQRRLKGTVPYFSPVVAGEYAHTDVQSLLSFLTVPQLCLEA
ncbi:hypothetical protein PC116_g26963 [Phytophthora cactorum]|nr:hypothetical protein PC123_g26057 [Phytophthora cactorum]KAG4224589.1 hypothetical protein PC116_g26963 [Phytophthora cactorum]